MREFTILGVTFTDYNAREALRRTEQFLHSGAMNTIAYVSYTNLAAAVRVPEQRAQMEALDLTLNVETAMLEAAGIASGSRLKEIEEQVYLKELFRKLAQNGRKVILLTMDESEIEPLEYAVRELQPNLNILQCRTVSAYEGRTENLLNDLNEAATDVILSALPFGKSLELMEAGKMYLNAEVWLALPEKKIPGQQKTSVMDEIRKKMFQKKVSLYKE